jgi:hypothetical protein
VKLSLALKLGRVSNLPTLASNVLTGAALSGAQPAAPVLAAWIAALALFYVGGMYLNDAFDRGWDAQHRPERPIPSGAVRAATVFAAGFGMLAAGLAWVALLALGEHGGGWPALLSAAGLAVVIVVNDLHHKGNALGPLLMGSCRVFVYVTVAVGLGGAWNATATRAAIALLGYLMGLSYVARQENLRALKQLWPLALLAAPFLLHPPLTPDPQTACAVLLLVAVLDALWLMFRARARDIPGAVGRLIAGISLLDALLVAALRPAYVLPCIVAYLLTRLLQRYVAAT